MLSLRKSFRFCHVYLKLIDPFSVVKNIIWFWTIFDMKVRRPILRSSHCKFSLSAVGKRDEMLNGPCRWSREILWSFCWNKSYSATKKSFIRNRAHQSSQVAQYMLLLSLLLLTLLSLFYHYCYCDYYIFNLEYSVSGYLLGHELISIYWKTDSRTFGTERDRIWLYCNNVIIASMVN